MPRAVQPFIRSAVQPFSRSRSPALSASSFVLQPLTNQSNIKCHVDSIKFHAVSSEVAHPPVVRKKSGVFYEKNRAVKTVSRHGGDTNLTVSVAERVISRRRGAHRSPPGERRFNVGI